MPLLVFSDAELVVLSCRSLTNEFIKTAVSMTNVNDAVFHRCLAFKLVSLTTLEVIWMPFNDYTSKSEWCNRFSVSLACKEFPIQSNGSRRENQANQPVAWYSLTIEVSVAITGIDIWGVVYSHVSCAQEAVRLLENMWQYQITDFSPYPFNILFIS